MTSNEDIFLGQPKFHTGWGNGWEILTALSVLASLFHFKQEQPEICHIDEEICNQSHCGNSKLLEQAHWLERRF